MKDGWFLVRNNEGQKTMERPSLKYWKKKKEKKKETVKPESTYGENILRKLGWNRHFQINESWEFIAGKTTL